MAMLNSFVLGRTGKRDSFIITACAATRIFLSFALRSPVPRARLRLQTLMCLLAATHERAFKPLQYSTSGTRGP